MAVTIQKPKPVFILAVVIVGMILGGYYFYENYRYYKPHSGITYSSVEFTGNNSYAPEMVLTEMRRYGIRVHVLGAPKLLVESEIRFEKDEAIVHVMLNGAPGYRVGNRRHIKDLTYNSVRMSVAREVRFRDNPRKPF